MPSVALASCPCTSISWRSILALPCLTSLKYSGNQNLVFVMILKFKFVPVLVHRRPRVVCAQHHQRVRWHAQALTPARYSRPFGVLRLRHRCTRDCRVV
ncbi:hypothetical protein VPH35_093591 [Triticum aestivum]